MKTRATLFPSQLSFVLAVGLFLGGTSAWAKDPATRQSAGEKGNAAADDSSSAIVRIVDFVSHPVLELATWPLEYVVAPGVEFLTYPTQPPLRYFLEENVIDRATGLFQFGPERSISVYPTLSLASGTSSRTGATFRHSSPFGREDEVLAAYFSYYVNGDYRLRTYLSSRGLGGTRFNGKLAFSLYRLESATFYQPDVNTPYVHALNAESYELEVNHPVVEEFFATTGFQIRNNRFDEAPPALANQASNVLTGDFFRADTGFDPAGNSRGFGQSFMDRVVKAGFSRDTRTNENIPLDGSKMEVTGYYHNTERRHDYIEWKGRYTAFYKLGAERYELTAREEKQYGTVSVDKILKQLEYQRLRQTIFSRKVLVVHLYAGRSYELPGNRMPAYGLQSLGNATPLRAYAGSRYRNYAVAAASTEYRFPVLRIMDGVFFNEYGVFGPSMAELDLQENLRNSWGFGVRVRRSDIFLFRFEMAFNGFSGATFNATADSPF